MRSLSSTVSEMPSSWDPSRSVVSKISTASGNFSSFVDMFDPLLVAIDFAPHGARVLLRDHCGHRTGTRNGAIVDRVHRAHLGGRAAHEHLVGDVEIAARELTDPHVVAVVAGDRHHRALGDAFERPRRQWR